MKQVARFSIVMAAVLTPSWALAVPDACDEAGSVFNGAESFLDDEDGSYFGEASDFLGRSIAVGDFNGDGVGDLAMGADGDDDNGSASGAVYLVLSPNPDLTGAGDAIVNLSYDVIIRGVSAGDRTGYSLANAGDIDGDGRDDLLIGTLPSAGLSGQAGVAYLVAGSTISTDTEIALATEATATFFGQAKDDQFGYAVSGAGDVNGDGFGDVLVGAYRYSQVGYRQGAAFLWYGPVTGTKNAGSTSGSGQDVRFDGAMAGGQFGAAVAGLGDLNDDGYDDIGATAVTDNSGGREAGATYVWYGGGLSAVENAAGADVKLFGSANEKLGQVLAPAGDIDGDSLPDFWVTAKLRNTNKSGTAWLIRGSSNPMASNMTAAAHFLVNGGAANDNLGSALASGDFNRDGIPDVLIGAERGLGIAAAAGYASVIYGPFIDGTVTNSIEASAGIILGSAYKDFVGAAVAAGDVNADGYADVFVGGPGNSDGTVSGGKVGLWQGGSDNADLVTYYRDEDGDGFGWAGTTNQDCSVPVGYVDNDDDCNDSASGGDLFYPAAPEPCGSPDYNCDTVTGGADNDLDGYAACASTQDQVDCDDTNNDINPGKDELCGDGIDNDCDGQVDDGSAIDAYTYYPDVDADGFGDQALEVLACEPPDFATAPVSIGGDCDDGQVEVNPGAPERCSNGVDDNCDGLTDDSSAVDAKLFWQDLDGDGYGDENIAIEACDLPASGYAMTRDDCDDSFASIAPGATETCDFADNDCGGMHYLGGPESVARAQAEFEGRALQGRLRPLGFLPDQDFDGDDEIVLAHSESNESTQRGGAVYIVRGELGVQDIDLDNVSFGSAYGVQVRIVGNRKETLLGSSAAMGDFNNDGIGDIAIGGPGARVPESYTGAVYVYYGPLTNKTYTLDDAHLTLKGEAGFQRFGTSVDVGDFDGDGFDDLVASAPEWVDSLPKQGKAYIFYGSASGLGTGERAAAGYAAAYFAGTVDSGRAGDPVASLGDIDGDGFDDLGVGSKGDGYLLTGAVRLFYGSATRWSGGLAPDAVINGASSGEQLPFTLDGIGDFDDDGHDDYAIGTNQNLAYLVLGGSTRVLGTVGVRTIAQTRFFGSAGQRFGGGVQGIGDLNDDGYADVAFTASDDSSLAAKSGAIIIVYGVDRARLEEVVPFGGTFLADRVESFGRLPPGSFFPTYSAANSVTLEGARVRGTEAIATMQSVFGGGDFDADGFRDLLMGSPNADRDPLNTETGRVYLFSGGPYGTDVFVTDGSDTLWYWDYDADTFSDINLTTFRACEMHRPISFRNPSNPVPRGLIAPTAELDCNDRDYTIYPGATEAAGVDGEDTDCDGYDIPNILPLFSITLLPPAPLATSTLSVDIDIDDTDPITTPIIPQFEWYRNGTLIGGQTSSNLLPTYFAAGDLITVRVRLDDTRGLTAWQEASVTIENSDPVLDACDLGPSVVTVGTDMAATAVGLFDDDVADTPFLYVTYKWQKLQQGTFWIDIPGQTTPALESCVERRVPTSDPQAQLINCTVGDFIRAVCTPRDPTGPGLAYNSTPAVIVNSAPVIESCVVTPTGPYTNDTLTVTPSFSDLDGDAVSVDYDWVVNGVPLGINQPTLDGAVHFDHFDTIRAQCTPRDARGLEGETFTSSPDIVVRNTAPTQPTYAIVPINPRSNQDIAAQRITSSTDLDNDPITYVFRWQRNGVPFNNPTYPTNVSFVLSGNTVKGDIWSVTITPTDGFDDGPSFTTQTTILNTPPTVAGVVITPSPAESRQLLVATPINFFDYDGDPNLSVVEWYVNGINVWTGPSLAPGYALRGQQVYVVYRPFDGTDYGASVTSSVMTMQNSPPEAIVLRDMEPIPAGEFDDIECVWNGPASDFDGDSVLYTVTFIANRPDDPFANPPSGYTPVQLKTTSGVALNHPTAWNLPDLGAQDETDPLAATDAIYGDQIFCRVTPNDGYIDGLATDATPVTVQDLNAPPSPTIDSVERYRNAETVTFTGTCISFPNDCGTLWFECVNELGDFLDSADPDDGIPGDCSSSVFSETLTLPRGHDWTCWSYCIDIGNNRSTNSNTRSTEVCDPYDAFELRGEAVGDSQGAAVDDWSALQDDSSATISFTGNIIGSGVEFSDTYDFYLIRTSDNPTDDNTDGENNYNLEMSFTTGGSAYRMTVYRDVGLGAVEQCVGVNYDSYNFYNYDRGDYVHAHHGTTYLADRQRCKTTTAEYNDCEDFTSNYYVRIARDPAANNCQSYSVQVRNEDPTWP